MRAGFIPQMCHTEDRASARFWGYGVSVDRQILVASYLLSTTPLFIPLTVMFCLISNELRSEKTLHLDFFSRLFEAEG